MAHSVTPLQWVAIKLIRLYQLILVPARAALLLHPDLFPICDRSNPTSRFHKGVWLASKRLLKCHPLSEGGYDPVPQPKRRN